MCDYFEKRDTDWIVMKYIENPLIVSRRKFDIRQWVLLTSVDPLIIWFFDDCYIRFAAEDYENGKEGENKYSHLTNNSIAKYSKKDDNRIPGNMWDTT